MLLIMATPIMMAAAMLPIVIDYDVDNYDGGCGSYVDGYC